MPYNPLIGACSGLPPHLHVSVSLESSGASAKIKPSVSLITGGLQPHHAPQRRFHTNTSGSKKNSIIATIVIMVLVAAVAEAIMSRMIMES